MKEFSKIIYIINIIFVICVVIASFAVVIFSGGLGIVDLSPITVIVTSAFSELAIFSTGYMVKSKAENTLKISKQIREDLRNEETTIKDLKTASAIMNGMTVEDIIQEYDDKKCSEEAMG